MSDNDRQTSGCLPGLAIGALTSNLAIPAEPKKGRTPLSTLLDLVSLGLVRRRDRHHFGIASFLLLYYQRRNAERFPHPRSGREVKPLRSVSFRTPMPIARHSGRGRVARPGC